MRRHAPAQPRGAREGRALGHEVGARAAVGGGQAEADDAKDAAAALARPAACTAASAQDGDRVPQLLEQPL